MMGQLTVLTYSYSMILVFFWALFLALSLGHHMRQVRVERLEAKVVISPNRSVTTKHLLAYVHSPLDEMQVWHGKSLNIVENIPGMPVMPVRYRQTLLFADELAETHPNPVTKLH